MNTQNFNNSQPTEKTSNEAKTIQMVQPGKPKEFAVVDMWNIQRQRKMIYRRSA